MDVGMGTVAPFVTDVVPGAGNLPGVRVGIGPLQAGKHLLVGQVPVAELVVQVVGAILQENLDGTDWLAPDQARIQISPRYHRMIGSSRVITDRGVAADHADYITECIGAVPRHGEGTDGAGAGAADGAALGVVGEFVGPGDLRQDLV